MIKTHSITKEFVVIDASKRATLETADAGLYGRLGANYAGFKACELISCHQFASDWDTWEIHPHGDEVVILLAGQVTFVLQLDGGETSVSLQEEGDYVVVPKDVWHTARTSTQSKLLFITPGEGTQNKGFDAIADETLA